jgi:hypothetical protein
VARVTSADVFPLAGGPSTSVTVEGRVVVGIAISLAADRASVLA